MHRRRFLGLCASGSAAMLAACTRSARDGGRGTTSAPATTTSTTTSTVTSTTAAPPSPRPQLAPLGEPDVHGLRLPPGARARVVATTGRPVGDAAYVWHTAPDGGAVFPTAAGGWIYVSNSETVSGGASSVTFAADGTIVGARRVLSGTSANCAGGATPWGTWLSCEEHPLGRVWECDPTGETPAVAHPAMGVFQHEAAAVDAAREAVYLTEDQPDGLLYRFLPDRWPDLSSGRLEALADEGGGVRWAPVADPTRAAGATRHQVRGGTRFDGGEGVGMLDGRCYFTTKGDGRVWSLDPDGPELAVVYDDDTAADPVLTGVDNLTATPWGDLVVAEDGGDLQLVVVGLDGFVAPLLQLTGVGGTELTGPAFSPDGRRLYFSSQRNPGTTYEVTFG